jgi:ADP-heptose:LPS heptosyltransferase
VAPWRRIGILRLDNAGDVVLAGPVARALRSRFPEAALTLVASTGGAAAAPLLPWLDAVEVWDALWQDASGGLPFGPDRETQAIDRLRRCELDAVVILTSFSQTPFAAAYACYVAGIRVRAGHEEAFGGGVLSHPIPGPAPVHQAERNLHLLRGLGVPVDDERLSIEVPSESRAVAATMLAERGIHEDESVVVVPGASCASRRYAPSLAGSALADIRKRTDRPIVIVGTAAESALAEPIRAAVPDALDLTGRTSLPEMAAVVAAAGVVVTNNSLAMHLADALDRPVVVTFAGTDREDEWAPRRAPKVLLRTPTACAPCRLFDCPFTGHPCLDIEPSAVADAVVRLLREPARPGRRTVP